MKLIGLLDLIEKMPAFRQLGRQWQPREQRSAVVLEAAMPCMIAALQRRWQLPVLVVTAQPENCKKLYEQLLIWSGSNVMLFPEPVALPYERIISDTYTEVDRLQVLAALAGYRLKGDGVSPPLVVTSATALMSKTAAYSDFVSACHTVNLGMDVEPFHLLSRWAAIGYRMETMVEVPGTMSHRGGIVDIYPLTSEMPVRIEFFGNTVDSIRLFDPANQRSVSSLSSIDISPATELIEQQHPHNGQNSHLFNNKDSLLDYLPQNVRLILDEPQGIEQAMAEFDREAEQLRLDKLERGDLPAGLSRPYYKWEELEPVVEDRQRILFASWGSDDNSLRLDFTVAPTYTGQLPAFIKKISELLNNKNNIIVVSHQASRLSELLEEEGVFVAPVTEIKQAPLPGSLALVQGSLDAGWVMNDNTCLFTDAEIFGFVKQRRLMKKRPASHPQLFIDITPGDYVVHVEHGIALFTGVAMMGSYGMQKEYLVLQYAAGDRIYVPTGQIDRVSRYIGAGEKPPVLSRLGTQEWTRAKNKAKEAAEILAQELLALYATHEVVTGFSFSSDTVWQQELEASFPYIETPDQLEAQQRVKEDMEKPKPMDRLICGDVGYGKTEVAIRAAFKAVMDNRQVAVLVPTTVLAEQHLSTFSERLNAFPIRVEAMSRFKSSREQKAVLEGLNNGAVDICIGTHRLLQKDVVFKNLGLLVIDEEQRFGVAHKEYLKKMRREVDVLTLSATPIPRTLHMSLVGVRDMSVMETPPEERLPIKTYVDRFDERTIREAILRELERNGQVFFVHNRVRNIEMIAGKLASLVPEARVSFAHGQMPEGTLETVMADFAKRKADVLVCTTIIESGLDMPNVNTLIVNDADRFGLTQLYQLRGRVGRGTSLAYTYFLYGEGRLTPTSQKRLRTIFEATELGVGLNIAMKDMEIRGVGTLLGARQSGHISAIGFSLYCRMLAEAVEGRKAVIAGVKEKRIPRLTQSSVDLPLPAYIPEEYIADINTRINLYERMVKVGYTEEITALEQEFGDRFGALPVEVENLFFVVRIKSLAAEAGIESISTEDGQIVLRRFKGLPFEKQKLHSFFNKDGVRVGVRQLTLNLRRLGGEWQKVLEGLLLNII